MSIDRLRTSICLRAGFQFCSGRIAALGAAVHSSQSPAMMKGVSGTWWGHKLAAMCVEKEGYRRGSGSILLPGTAWLLSTAGALALHQGWCDWTRWGLSFSSLMLLQTGQRGWGYGIHCCANDLYTYEPLQSLSSQSSSAKILHPKTLQQKHVSVVA